MTISAVDAAAKVLGALATRDAPLGARTTYRVGGNAALFVVARDLSDLRRVRTAVMETNIDVLIVGKGSNMLVADAGFGGIAVTLEDALADVQVVTGTDDNYVRAGGGRSFPEVARRAAALDVGGLEWAVGIPGTVGGAVRMNAGGHGSDVASCLRSWSFVDLRGGPDGERSVDQLSATYRHTAVGSAHVVTEAVFNVHPVAPGAAEAKIAEIVRWRRENQPGGQNAGSIFTNPEGDSAGRIIDACGLKGLRIGSAEVSPKHANFIQADKDGSADDVHALIRELQRRVLEDTGIALRTEVRMIGFTEP
ncbi:MAG TPA: UDP-N-acetylmuramate dehydrogenase [Acidimicrobiales bacterium]|nr:UDP-N-acetylmuramate dehydrogenase [Acidimicrobiales bacterium]